MAKEPSFDVDALTFLTSEETVSLSLAEVGKRLRTIADAVLRGDRAAVRPFMAFARNIHWPTTRREHIPTEIRRAVLQRDGHRCLICRSIDRLELDHIIPYSKGGQSTMENLRTLCRRCNRCKGAR